MGGLWSASFIVLSTKLAFFYKDVLKTHILNKNDSAGQLPGLTVGKWEDKSLSAQKLAELHCPRMTATHQG